MRQKGGHQTTTPVVFLDFDGTITRRDVTAVILESYAGESWLEVERRWRAGQIGSRGEMRLDFPYFRKPCEHGCATCKPAVMGLHNSAGAPSVFVGDGLYDWYAAACADLVFAKAALAEYCREQEIEHVAYEKLREVASRLDSMLDLKDSVGSFAALPATV